jgi:hypothetical protein
VIRVEMRQEDVLEIDEPCVRPEQLPLRSLAAVDEQAIAAATDQRGRGSAGRRRRGARRPQEDEVEIHGRRS